MRASLGAVRALLLQGGQDLAGAVPGCARGAAAKPIPTISCSALRRQPQLLRALNCKCKSPPKLHFHAASFIFYRTLSSCPQRNSWTLPCTNSRENQGNNKGKALLSLKRQEAEKSHQCSTSQSLKNRILAWKNPVED